MTNQIESVSRFVRPSVYGAIIVYSVTYFSGHIRRWDLSKKCRDSFSYSIPWYTSDIITDHLSFLPDTVSSFIRNHVPTSYEHSSAHSRVVWG